MTTLITDLGEWLRDEDNRAVVAMLGAAVVAVLAGGWAVFKYWAWASEPGPASTASADRGGVALRDMHGGTIHVSSGVGAEDLRGLIEPIVASSRGKDEQIGELTERLGFTEGAVRSFFATVDANQVPRENWPETLGRIATDYRRLRDELRAMVPDDEEGAKKKDEALRALEAGDYGQAERLLAEWEKADLDAAEHVGERARHHRRRAAEARASRGDLAMTRIDYLTAAEHFQAAATMVRDIDASVHDRYLERRAAALYRQGDEKGDNDALEQCINLRRTQLTVYTRERVPLQWAATQNNLGNALRALGARESDTARLEEAVAAFREALKEYTREGVPLQWATAQNNLGNALQSLGVRESGTTRLEGAVAAFREALGSFEAAGASHYIEIVRHSLERAQRLLDERRGGGE